MKTYGLVVFMVFAVVSINAQEEELITHKRIQECFIEAKVPSELQQDNIRKLVENPKLKCFSACMMKKKGTMQNGKINPERQLLGMRPDSEEMIITCSTIANQQQDECEIAYSYIKCFGTNISVHEG